MRSNGLAASNRVSILKTLQIPCSIINWIYLALYIYPRTVSSGLARSYMWAGFGRVKSTPDFGRLSPSSTYSQNVTLLVGVISPQRIDRKAVNAFLCFPQSSYMPVRAQGPLASRGQPLPPELNVKIS